MKKLLLVLSIAVLVLAAVIVIRTLLHTPAAMKASPETGSATAPATGPATEMKLDDQAMALHLAEAIRFKTVSNQRAADAQNEEFVGFIDWVKTTYPEVNATLSLEILGDYTLLYKWAGTNAGQKPVLLTGHYDVVPVIPGSESKWEQTPFGGKIVDGVVWGRGALDDKSGVVAQLEAVTYLIRTGFVPGRTLYLSFGHDEEVGGVNGAASVAAHLAAQNVQLEWSLDEGSFLFDGMMPGVSERMAAINVAEKGSVTLQIVATGQGGHSSMPPRQSAVGLLAEAITTLESNPVPGGLSGLSEEMFDTASRYMPFSSRLFFANRWLFGSQIEEQLSAVTFSNAMLRTTTAPTMLSGSVKTNVLPIEAIATVNFRLHPRDSVESLVAYVSDLVGNEHVEVRVPEGAGRAASEVSSWDSVGFEVVEQSLRDVFGEVVVTPGLMIAGSDTRHYGKVADNSFRFNPFVVTPDDMTGFHGTNEKITVANFAQGVKTYVKIIERGTQR